ncbi:DUF975 family protein [Clostridium sardiniense]|uniref:DUF975 family protein n=1 Tax=Clostridium sardiniense TaxID=29369 RepID=A0ABS7KUC6_CLOSR|nr:DUF975 family protein [Clostridium sardiniense]MBY0754425.1 DUF975 family protein [Clostridium sardiniense]MDQ0461302.1 putative membrane protein [Clostridium sardiniense]
MISKEIREQSRLDLRGKWLKLALITLVIFIIVFVVKHFTNEVYLGSLISLAISSILGTFSKAFYINFYKTKEINVEKGFPNIKVFLRYFGMEFMLFAIIFIIYLLMFCLLIIGTLGFIALDFNKLFSIQAIIPYLVIIFIVSMIVITIIVLFYFAVPFLIVEGNSIFKSLGDSIVLMRGKKWRLFKLQLSFIGWAILSILSFGIGFLWLTPYYCESITMFYFKVILEEE